ncbi:DEAD/DEAH box helicase [Gammaproteobacteria bacterium]|nr:DEAD/DEAH box helicase [Gammaproteobacteria bacterium]
MSLIRKKLNLKLSKQAFPFQKEALDVIKNQEYFAIFHEQGLGKTKIAIDLSFYWLEENIVDSVLIVTKKSLINNWDEEFKIHGNIEPLILTNDRTNNSQKFLSAGAIYLCNYELIRNDIERFLIFCNMRKIGIILDESTQIKTPTSNISKSLHKLAPSCNRRLIMTGTPISNRPYDIWSQIYFLDFGKRLGQIFDNFRDDHDLTNNLYKSKSSQMIYKNNLEVLYKKIKDCSLRETKESAGINLPGKKFIGINVDMDSQQMLLYKKMQIELSAEVLKDGRVISEDVEVILKRLIRLVQISSNPSLVDERYKNIPPKLIETEKIIKKAFNEKSKVIIWTNFVDNAKYLINYFNSHSFVGIHGDIKTDERNKIISSFRNNENTKVLIATPGVAREGLTLVEANYAIFFDRNFSLENYLQAQDRIYRISQEKDCYIYKLISKNSIDLWVDALLEAKEISARFGQGDINENEYSNRIKFDFSELLQKILSGED